MSTIALFGGSGRTGKRILQLLLENGHDVRLLTRHPIQEHENMLEIIGDATNPEIVSETVKTADFVISALGTDDNQVLSRFTPIVMDAMKRHGVKRIITVGTAGILRAHESDKYRFETKESKRRSTTAAEDHARAFELLEHSGLDFTIICPTQLIEGPSTGKMIVTKDQLGTLHSGPISRDDVAKLVISCWQNHEYIGHRVGITTEL